MGSIELNSATLRPLDGINLIEASAGTGKTYNIENFYIRFVLKEVPVESILVVTFTEAATKELKGRIRRFLRLALEYNKNNLEKGSEFNRIENLHTYYQNKTRNIKLLETALQQFDEASIHTIHGFCQRLLRDNTFETSMLYSQRLETGSDFILQEAVSDYFRKYFYTDEPTLITILQVIKVTPASLLKIASDFMQKKDIKIYPSPSNPSNPASISNLFQTLKSSWEKDRIQEILLSGRLNGNRYRKTSVPNWIQQADNLFNGIADDTIFEKVLPKLTTTTIKDSVKSGNTPPQHPFFDTCEVFLNRLRELKSEIYLHFSGWLKKHISDSKVSQNIYTFDDLIQNVWSALYISNDPLLLTQLNKKYQCVLIDEFQDTDQLQYDIFKRAFLETGIPTFLVGDPKQAIYRFRGADVYVYKKAAEDIKKHPKGRVFTLTTNFRSEPSLIEAVNTLFSENTCPTFVNDFIKYLPIKAGANLNVNNFLVNGITPYSLLTIFHSPDIKTKEAHTQTAFSVTVSEIQKLLTSPKYSFSNGKAIKPHHIAILVHSHDQAQRIYTVLSKQGIPAVMQKSGNIFDTQEAAEMERLIYALNTPNRIRSIKGVLASSLFEMTWQDIAQYDEISDIFDEWLMKFHKYHDTWQQKSFIQMFNLLFEENNIKAHLLSQEFGERKFTNFQHLSELIQQYELENQPDISSLLHWVSKQMNPETRDKSDEYEIRLETDSDAVQIMTVHKSKGLEFPIVFCPFLWSRNTKPQGDYYEYHNTKGQNLFDFAKQNENIVRDENLEELMRLAYVAITRAKHKCYLYFGNLSDNSSALNYLFYRMNPDLHPMKKGEIGQKLIKKTTDLNSIQPDNTIQVIPAEDIPIIQDKFQPEKRSIILQQKDFPEGRINKDAGITSFSRLITYHSDDYDDIDHDKLSSRQDILFEEYKSEIMKFPGGVTTGNCWHDIFENIDFTAKEDSLVNIITEKLTEYHLLNNDSIQNPAETVLSMVNNVLNVPLNNSSVKLSDITMENRLSELEFLLPAKKIKIENITTLLKKYDTGFTLNSEILQGFITGFIDLVFRHEDKYYIIDWKSNIIDSKESSFDRESVKNEMKKHHYFLQYLIYTVALDRYLHQRLPSYDYNRNFGGVYYFFLRGIDIKDANKGIWHDKPEKELIEQLAAALGLKR